MKDGEDWIKREVLADLPWSPPHLRETESFYTGGGDERERRLGMGLP